MWSLGRYTSTIGVIAGTMAVGLLPSGATGVARSAPEKVLYSQEGDFQGNGMVSELFTGPYAPERSLGADDFNVPADETWTVSEVDVQGAYQFAWDTRVDVMVMFYVSLGDQPTGHMYRLIVRRALGPDFALRFPSRAVTLPAGQYWMSIQVIGPPSVQGPSWTWETRTAKVIHDSVWRNPKEGFHLGCGGWQPTIDCASGAIGHDYNFVLRGTKTP